MIKESLQSFFTLTPLQISTHRIFKKILGSKEYTYYCFRLIATTKRSVSLSANLTEGLRLPEKEISKTAHTLVWCRWHEPLLSILREERLYFSIFSWELSKFSVWKKLNASYVMSATDSPPRCKDKKNLANDVHCEL